MHTRFSFPLGLLLGALGVFGTRRRWLSPGRPTPPFAALLDLVGEAVVTADLSGPTFLNAAARSLLGADGAGLDRLCYPSGQPVPPGQLPLRRALLTGAKVTAGYLVPLPDGTMLALDVDARPLPGGGAAAVIKDMTQIRQALEDSGAQAAAAQQQARVLLRLYGRLGEAADAGEMARATVESALALTESLPDARVRLYLYDSRRQSLTRLASAPDNRPKRPRSQWEAQPPTFPFDASSPLLWSLYVAREAAMNQGWEEAGEETGGSACALPLTAGRVALGHLSVTCRAAGADDPTLREALAGLVSVAAPAFAGQRERMRAASLEQQAAAVGEVVQAIGRGTHEDALAELLCGHVSRAVGGEVCTLALGAGNRLRLAGTTYKDALLFPERFGPDDPALTREAARAEKAGKTVQQVGRRNPRLEDGPWRAFAGQSGCHSVLSVPLAAGQGALTLYRAGSVPFAAADVRFMETMTALVSAALLPASRPAARPDGLL